MKTIPCECGTTECPVTINLDYIPLLNPYLFISMSRDGEMVEHLMLHEEGIERLYKYMKKVRKQIRAAREEDQNGSLF